MNFKELEKEYDKAVDEHLKQQLDNNAFIRVSVSIATKAFKAGNEEILRLQSEVLRQEGEKDLLLNALKECKSELELMREKAFQAEVAGE